MSKKKSNDVYIDKDIYETIENVLINNGIRKIVLEVAKLMDNDLPTLFYKKLINTKGWDEQRRKNEKNALSKNLLGIYGNCLARHYYLTKGCKVINEAKEHDKAGYYYVDLKVIDKDGNLFYCEVKTTQKIISPTKSYYESDEYLSGDTPESKREFNKYREIGKQLLKQVTRLHNNGMNVKVVKFSGCIIDDEVTDELENLNIGTPEEIPTDVKKLEECMDHIVDNVERVLFGSQIIQEEKRRLGI